MRPDVDSYHAKCNENQILLLVVIETLQGLCGGAVAPTVCWLQRRLKVLPTDYKFVRRGNTVKSLGLNADYRYLKKLGLLQDKTEKVNGETYKNMHLNDKAKDIINDKNLVGIIDKKSIQLIREAAFRARNQIAQSGLSSFSKKIAGMLSVPDEYQQTLVMPSTEVHNDIHQIKMLLLQNVTEYMGKSASRDLALSNFIKIRKTKPHDNWDEFDQFAAAPASVMLELEYMFENLSDSTVIFLGGNDGMPVLIDIMSKLGLIRPPREMIVLEGDQRIKNWLDANIKSLNHTIELYNLKDPLPAKFMRMENVVVFADPPFNCPGMELLSRRASQICEKGCHFYLCVPTGAPWTSLLDAMATNRCTKYGFAIKTKDSIPVKYENSTGSINSLLWHLVKQEDVVIDNSSFLGDIYHSCRHDDQYCLENMGSLHVNLCKTERNNWWQSMRPQFNRHLIELISDAISYIKDKDPTFKIDTDNILNQQDGLTKQVSS